MPTGYTYGILEGQTFEQFVWSCAKAFGAFIVQRDDPSGSPPVMTEEASDYHAKELEEARKTLDDLKSWDDEAWANAHAAYVAGVEQSNRESIAKAAETRCMYQAMLDRVQSWTPPTSDHAGLKKFMIDQINLCENEGDPYLSKARPLAEWKADKLSFAEREIDYHAKHQQKEAECVAGRNRWKADLAASVPVPPQLESKAQQAA